MPKVRVRGVEIYYEERGQGTPVMLVAGYGGAGSYWAPQMLPFSQQFRPIQHDHRGTGRSTHDTTITYSLDQMADDVVGLMDALKIDKAHFVGHSLGGLIGQNLGIRHADRFHDLVIYASVVGKDPWLKRCMEMRRTLLKTAGPRAFARATPLFLYPDWWINANGEVLAALEEATVAAFPPTSVIESRSIAIERFVEAPELHRLKIPTLLLCARDDFLTPPYFTERLAELIPHAELVWMQRGGHACSQTVPEEFNAIVLDFLKRHEPA